MDFVVDRGGADGEREEEVEDDGTLEKFLFGAQDELEDTGAKRKNPDADDSSDVEPERPAAAAWVDNDDFGGDVSLVKQDRLKKLRTARSQTVVSVEEYEKRLRQQYARTAKGSGAWARLSQNGGDVELDTDLAAVGKLLKVAGASRFTGRGLPGGTIDILRTLDANKGEPSQSVVKSVEFHPQSSAILMTAGFDKRIRLFQVDGNENKKIHSVYTPLMPIHTARFTRNGSEVVCSGRKPYFYQYDVESGRAIRVSTLQGSGQRSLERFSVSPDGSTLAFPADNGKVLLVSNASKQQTGVLKMSNPARICAFSRENEVYCYSSDSRVYGWDLRMQRCFLSFSDDAGISGTALTCSSSGLLACGSETGVVNVYENPVRSESGSDPKLIKSVTNLTTSISTLQFSPDSEILAIASREDQRSLRLLHTGTMTVFSNWPTTKTRLKRVTDCSFSEDGTRLAIGNDGGLVPTFVLKHYVK